jgi:hypothetical protein
VKVNGHVLHVAFFASMWVSRPVFHRWRFPSDHTVCGLEVFNDGGDFKLTAIPPAHAVKIGRPCRKCFR